MIFNFCCNIFEDYVYNFFLCYANKKNPKHKISIYDKFSPVISACEDGFEEVSGHCYLIVTDQMTMAQAAEHCSGLGAILAEPRTPYEQFVVGHWCMQNYDYCFLGLVGDGSGGYVWRTDLTQPINTAWMGDQPHTQNGECVVYRHRMWIVDHCTSNHRFICQKCKYFFFKYEIDYFIDIFHCLLGYFRHDVK